MGSTTLESPSRKPSAGLPSNELLINDRKMPEIPELRIKTLNETSVNESGEFVLYWMVANRRMHWNYSLDRAVEWATKLGKPLVVLEALRCDYRWASDRLHWFVIQGMADNAAASEKLPVTYYPYLEQEKGQGDGLIETLADKAAVIVSDEFPTFFISRMQSQIAPRLPVKMEVIDSNGMLPMRATDKVFSRAYDFRRYLQKELKPFLFESPQENALTSAKIPDGYKLPAKISKRWPMADVKKLAADPKCLADFPIDHEVGLASFDGGESAGVACLLDFLEERFARYAEDRSDMENGAASGMSPYLHFGHLSSHQVFAEVTELEGWNPSKTAEKANGARAGWWGASETFESFIDEFITWREVGYNFCSKRTDYARFNSLPDWAKATHAEHADDEREYLYNLEQFETAQTHDPLWNAAQTELNRTGRMQNYLRMLWGKKILEWTPSAQAALKTMIHLNNKYAVDGRNPNSYSGIFWVLGRYDRAWGPERPVFGKTRYMSSDNTARKYKVKEYIKQFDPQGQGSLF